ncbi:hypothetical protein L195_g061559, partial [Trifolium pratense]
RGLGNGELGELREKKNEPSGSSERWEMAGGGGASYRRNTLKGAVRIIAGKEGQWILVW